MESRWRIQKTQREKLPQDLRSPNIKKATSGKRMTCADVIFILILVHCCDGDVCIRCTDSIIGFRCYNADIIGIRFICHKIDDIWQFNISSTHSSFTCEQGGGLFSIKGGVCPTSTIVLPGTSTEPVTTLAPPVLEKGAIAGITVAVIIGVILLTGIFVLCWFLGKCMWSKAEEQREPVPAVRYTATEQQCAEGAVRTEDVQEMCNMNIAQQNEGQDA